MVKLILKLAILALIANALYQVVPPFYTNWKFRDALKELASFSQRRSIDQILDRCVVLAKEHDLALERTDFTVQKGRTVTTIDTSVHRRPEVHPGQAAPASVPRARRRRSPALRLAHSLAPGRSTAARSTPRRAATSARSSPSIATVLSREAEPRAIVT